jgi:hypothetical protein
MATFFSCNISSFPQTYLGPPLSIHKLCIVHFNPIMSKCDMRLSGWHGRSLPIGGHLLLVNSGLTAIITHAMGDGLLPASVFFFEQHYRRGSPYGVNFILKIKRNCTSRWSKVPRNPPS